MGPDGPNRYAYARNAPLEFIDQNGEYVVFLILAFLLLNVDPANAPGPGDQTYSPTSTGGMIIDATLGLTGGLLLGKLAKPCAVKPTYLPRIRERAVVDPKAHNFPYSFDEFVLKQKPQILPDGSKFYNAPGTINKTPGKYEIIVNPKNEIYHRNFNSKK